MKKSLSFFFALAIMTTAWVSCAGTENTNTTDKMETVFGFAQNTAHGAVIENKSGIFLVAGKESWETEFLSKRVKATGTIEYTEAKDGKGYNGHSDKMRVLKNATIVLAQ